MVTLGYDAVQLLAQAMLAEESQPLLEAIEGSDFEGINGPLNFTDGYWLDAPTYRYTYERDGPGEAIRFVPATVVE
jgi:ABC-type branched-subunit amino acid transport system substrate-binding protein